MFDKFCNLWKFVLILVTKKFNFELLLFNFGHFVVNFSINTWKLFFKDFISPNPIGNSIYIGIYSIQHTKNNWFYLIQFNSKLVLWSWILKISLDLMFSIFKVSKMMKIYKLEKPLTRCLMLQVTDIVQLFLSVSILTCFFCRIEDFHVENTHIPDQYFVLFYSLFHQNIHYSWNGLQL